MRHLEIPIVLYRTFLQILAYLRHEYVNVWNTPLMRHVLKLQLLNALRDSLQDVENLKLIPGDDPQVAGIRNDLRKTITEIENDGAPEC